MKKKSPKLSIMITGILLAAMLAGMWLATIYRSTNSQAMLLPNREITVFPDPKPLSEFMLTDHNNQVFDLSRLAHKWSFLFFGFTNCPDICPVTLSLLSRAREEIVKSSIGAENIQFIFVSVDPNRDTTSKLEQYVTYFDKEFLGVSGDNQEIHKLASQLGVPYEVNIGSETNSYSVSHSSAVFLVDPQKRYHAVFTQPNDAEVISRRFRLVYTLETNNK